MPSRDAFIEVFGDENKTRDVLERELSRDHDPHIVREGILDRDLYQIKEMYQVCGSHRGDCVRLSRMGIDVVREINLRFNSCKRFSERFNGEAVATS